LIQGSSGAAVRSPITRSSITSSSIRRSVPGTPQGVGRFCYGEGTTNRSRAFKPTPDGTIYCYDPDDSSKGTHAYPYVSEVWAYDAAALASVRAGRKRPWQVRPYATWRLSLPFNSPRIGGAAYDAAHRLIYLSQQYADGAAPVIDVFKVR
jgi:hypothetical protein